VVLILCAAAFTGCSNASPRKDAGSTSTASASASASSSGATSLSSPGTPASSSSASASSASTTPSGGAGATATDQPSDQPSAHPSAQGTRTPHLPRDRVEAAALHTSVLGRNSAGTAGEQAVVQTWMRYWQAASNTLFFVRPDKDLRATARGQALSWVLGDVTKFQAQKQRIVGWARDNVTSVEVHGDRAEVRDCTTNFTFTVDEEGDPLTRPTPFYDVTGHLTREAGRWVVTDIGSKSLTSSCLS
jgi:hypothetical protein